MAYATPPKLAAGVTPTAAYMNIIRAGLEETAKPPIGWVASNAIQVVANGVVPPVTFATTRVLNNVTFAGGAGGLVLVETGMYIGIVHALWGSSTAGIRVVTLMQNGGNLAAKHSTPGAATNWSEQTIVYPFMAAAGSTMQASVFQDSGGNLALLAGTSLFIKLISRL